MFIVDPLSEARERARRLRAEADAERRRPRTARRPLAETVRRAADGLDPAVLAVRLSPSRR